MPIVINKGGRLVSFFSKQTELVKKIKEQDDELIQLREINRQQEEKNSQLNTKIKEQIKTIERYENKYVHTNLECEFCYTTLQESFLYCPRCGKRIVSQNEKCSVENKKHIFETELDGGKVLITRYIGFHDSTIIIPSTIEGKTVIGIWNQAFAGCKELEEVIFEEGCQYIGTGAFSGCSKLKKVHLPKSLIEIGARAFASTDIEEIAIPPSVKVIGSSAFFNCKKLHNVILPNALSVIEYGVFEETGLYHIDLPNNIRHICRNAFANTKISIINLPTSLYSLGNGALEISCLKEVTIQSNVEIIETYIFGINGVRPLVKCVAGSKAQLYARNKGLQIDEISPQKATNTNKYSQGIFIEMNSWKKSPVPKNFFALIGCSKAETWAWELHQSHCILINKSMSMEEALWLSKRIQEYIDMHTDYSIPPYLRPRDQVTVYTEWGITTV